MEPIELYRKAIRSGRVEMMSEVVVRLSTLPGCNEFVESLMRQIDLLTEGNPAAEKMKTLLKG